MHAPPGWPCLGAVRVGGHLRVKRHRGLAPEELVDGGVRAINGGVSAFDVVLLQVLFCFGWLILLGGRGFKPVSAVLNKSDGWGEMRLGYCKGQSGES